MESNYTETLELIEELMQNTGIREYCTDMCKGACCQGCHDSENACYKHEGRRLGCSTFLCHVIKMAVLTPEQHELWTSMKGNILRELMIAQERTDEGHRSPYFDPVIQKTQDVFKADTFPLEKLINIHAKDIDKRLMRIKEFVRCTVPEIREQRREKRCSQQQDGS